MLRIEGDRRRYPRVPMERPCKLFEPRSQKYVAATTRDWSTGGLLLDAPKVLNLQPGDQVHVGVAMKRRQGFLLAPQMIQAVVLRALTTIDDHTTLAVQFNSPISVPAGMSEDSATAADHWRYAA